MHARSALVFLGLLALALPLAGCQACAPTQPAHAQAGDGGVPQQIIIVPVRPEPEPQPRPEPDAPATCYLRAQTRTNLVDPQIAALCTGAWTSAPVSCYLEARRISLTDDQRIALCRCADSIAPVACYRRLDRSTALTDTQIAGLCAPTIALGLLPNCRPVGYY